MFLLSLTATCQVCTVSLKAGLYTYKALQASTGPSPAAPPPRITSTRGRKRQVDTSHHCCPHPDCAYRGWVGLGNLRANGHPSGGQWRQRLCVACRRYFLETLGTLFHGKRAPVELIVRVVA